MVLILPLATMAHAYVKRAETAAPRWIGRVQTATPRFAFTLGFLLLGVFPTDILCSASAPSGSSRTHGTG